SDTLCTQASALEEELARLRCQPPGNRDSAAMDQMKTSLKKLLKEIWKAEPRHAIDDNVARDLRQSASQKILHLQETFAVMTNTKVPAKRETPRPSMARSGSRIRFVEGSKVAPANVLSVAPVVVSL
ncbi:unnamed protein product, partial [Polarella glacialis]